MTTKITSSAQWRQVTSANSIVVTDCEFLLEGQFLFEPSLTVQSTPTGAARAR